MDIQSCQPEEERPDHRALPKSCNNVGYVFLWGSDEVSELFPKNTCTSKCVYPFKRWVVATDPPPPAKDCPWATAEAPLLAVLVLGEQALSQGL